MANDNKKILDLQTTWIETKDDKYLWDIYQITNHLAKVIIKKIAKEYQLYIDPNSLDDKSNDVALSLLEKQKEGFAYKSNPVSIIYCKCKQILFTPTNDELFIKALNSKDINERNAIFLKLTTDMRGRHNSPKPRKKK